MAAAERILSRGLVVGTLAFGACGSDAPCEAHAVSAALTAGGAGPGYLALSDVEAGAVGLVRLRLIDVAGEPFTNDCTGVLFAPRWVLSAKHCLREQDPEQPMFLIGPNADEARAHPIERVVPHAELDLVLFELAKNVPAHDAQPLQPLAQLDATRWESELAQIGGFGRRPDGDIGQREFVAEPIVDILADQVWVDGEGRSGACKGDSGGPLLVRGPDGGVNVMAILSEGSPSCTGIDRFVRVDVANDWIASYAGVAGDAPPAPCGRITSEGACFGAQAVWCEHDALATAACDDARPCGWNADERGYRCRRAQGDPCEGVDQAGRCGPDGALSCAAGSLRLRACAACGLECDRAPETGAATCLPALQKAP